MKKDTFNYGHYYNTPLNIEPVLKGQEDLSLIKKIKITDKINPTQKIIINTRKYILEICGEKFPICIGDKNFNGKYSVIEKFEYPYYKGKNFFYYPGENNILGKYLIILGNTENGKKINQGLHSFPKTLGNFKQGYIKGNGCIRLDPKYEEKIFNIIELGAKVIIK